MQITRENSEILALQALGFILEDNALRDRFLALTGLIGAELRNHIADDGFLLNVMDFLASNEPDLIACAEALNENPEALLAAWHALGGQIME